MSTSLLDMVLDVSSAPRPGIVPAPAPGVAARNPVLHATTAESLVVVVAPGNGRFHPSQTLGGVRAGEVLGHLTVGQGRTVEVPSPADLRVEGLLTRPGQLITAGDALLWGRLQERDAA
jgi:hypothetical protein